MAGGGFFTKEFQVELIAHLAKDEELFKASSHLRLSDIDIEPARLVLETLRDYYAKLGWLPDLSSLQMHVRYMIHNQEGRTQTIITPEDYEYLAYTLEKIANKTKLDSAYYRKLLPDYLKYVRLHYELAASQDQINLGQGVRAFIQRVAAIDESVHDGTDIEIDSMDENPEAVTSHQDLVRIPTILNTLNQFTTSGLGAGELGIVVACTGVGKTTALINFSMGAEVAGYRSLFLTLELAKRRIKHRKHSIAAHIPAGYFKMLVQDWPVEMIKRYEAVLNPKTNRYFGYGSISDMSTRKFTLNDIDDALKKWKDQMEDKYGDGDKCKAVYLDWLDKLSYSGLEVTNDERSDRKLAKICEALGDLARKHDVALWTATQGTRGAVNQDVLHMDDVAEAYHKMDAIDIGLGIGEAYEDRNNTAEGTESPECNRHLTANIMKNRDNPPHTFPFYQGKTLRFYDNVTKERMLETMLQKGQWAETQAINTKEVTKYAKNIQVA